MSFSLKQNYHFHDVKKNNKSSSSAASSFLSNTNSAIFSQSGTSFAIVAARRAAIIALSDLLTSKDADLSTQVFIPTATSALIIEAPFYVWDVTNNINRIHRVNNPLATSTKGATVVESVSASIIPVNWKNIMGNVRGLEFTCFFSHCLVVAFYWGNYIGRYYNLKSFIQRELKPKKPANEKETIFLTDAAKRKAEFIATSKDFSLDVFAAELSRFWAVMLRSPFEVIRTNLIRDCYYINNNDEVKKTTAGAAVETIVANANPLGRKFNGMGDCASKVLKEQGVRVLFRRCQRQYLRLSGLATSIALVSYDRHRHGTQRAPEKLTLGKILY